MLARNSISDLLKHSIPLTIGVMIALVCLIWIISRIRTWFGEDEDRAGDNHELLSHIRELHTEGDLSEEEFRSIKGRLIQKLDDESSSDQS